MVTFLVIVIGAAALFIVLSAFAGLKTFSLSFSNTFDPDLKAITATGKYFTLEKEEIASLDSLKSIAHYATEIEERIFLTHKQRNHVAWIKAVDTNYTRVIPVQNILYFGSWIDKDPYQVVGGIGIANMLGLAVNDYRSPMKILAPKPGEGGITSQKKPYNQLPVTLSGVYAINEEMDRKYVFARLDIVQPLLEKDQNQITGINFKMSPGASEESAIADIESILGDKVTVKNRAQLNEALYKMLNTENLAIYLIFTLVLIIALFNVVGAIIMMILDKQGNLKTLFSIGMPIKKLRRIFFLQGVLVTASGGLIGITLASLLVWSQIAFQWIKLTPSLPYPVEFTIPNLLIVFATILVLGVIASKIASSRISKRLIEFN